MLSGRGICDELITRPEESYRLCCVVVCDQETSRMGAAYIYDISRLMVNTMTMMTRYSRISRHHITVPARLETCTGDVLDLDFFRDMEYC